MLFFVGVVIGFLLTFLVFRKVFADARGEFKLCEDCTYKKGFIRSKVTNIEEVAVNDDGTFNGNFNNN